MIALSSRKLGQLIVMTLAVCVFSAEVEARTRPGVFTGPLRGSRLIVLSPSSGWGCVAGAPSGLLRFAAGAETGRSTVTGHGQVKHPCSVRKFRRPARRI